MSFPPPQTTDGQGRPTWIWRDLLALVTPGGIVCVGAALSLWGLDGLLDKVDKASLASFPLLYGAFYLVGLALGHGVQLIEIQFRKNEKPLDAAARILRRQVMKEGAETGAIRRYYMNRLDNEYLRAAAQASACINGFAAIVVSATMLLPEIGAAFSGSPMVVLWSVVATALLLTAGFTLRRKESQLYVAVREAQDEQGSEFPGASQLVDPEEDHVSG